MEHYIIFYRTLMGMLPKCGSFKNKEDALKKNPAFRRHLQIFFSANLTAIFNRPGVAGAALQSPSSLIN